MCRTWATTESGVFWVLVFGVVVIGEKLFGRADNGKMDSGLRKARVQPVGDEWVGDVLAVPSEQKIHSMHTGGGDMEGIAASDAWKNAAGDQPFGERPNQLVEVEKRNTVEQLKALRGLRRFAIGGLVENELRSKKVELLPPCVPPLPSQVLLRELPKVARWT